MARRFGVEIEATGLNQGQVAATLRNAGMSCFSEQYNHETRTYWKVVPDGSLVGRGAPTFELVSPPLPATEAGYAEVAKACAAIRAAGARANKSCGFHVHVEAPEARGELTGPAALKRLLSMFVRFEWVFDQMVSPSRRANKNVYCKSNKRALAGCSHLPDGDLDAMRDRALARVEQCRTLDDLRYAQRNSRYLKLNIESVPGRGTVEFRMHNGTTSPDTAAAWAALMVGFVEVAFAGGRAYKAKTVSTPRLWTFAPVEHQPKLRARWEHLKRTHGNVSALEAVCA